jgi:hypothetical protein
MGLYLRNNNRLGFADSLTGAAAQAAAGPGWDSLDGEVEHIAGAKLDAGFAAVASVRIHVNEIDFKISSLFRHGKPLFIL